MKKYIMTILIGLISLMLISCSSDDAMDVDDTDIDVETSGYTGTGMVSQGLASTTTASLVDCSGGRIAGLGTILDSESNTWMVPAEVNFTDSSFPFSSDLHNPCSGNQYQTTEAALAALDGSDIIEIDSDGEVITAFVFADNYFEMYVNGIPVGKDPVPFTTFNSDIVRFKVSKPFTVAMKLVDWEENLGVGTESNQGFSHHAGDGGMVAVFQDADGETIDVTNDSWKAQTFYTAPVKNLTCLTESNNQRLSTNCDDSGSNDGSEYYGVHWFIPTDWTSENFDDSSWPDATTYTNATIGVDNKSAYTNFTDIFDNSSNDAEFIWSTNVVLDNEVLVRKTIQ